MTKLSRLEALKERVQDIKDYPSPQYGKIIRRYRELKELNGALIYCDIPYQGTKGFSTSKDFDHDVFWEWVRMMSESNVVIVSEQSHPEDFVVIWEQTVTRTQDNRKRLTVTEKLVCHTSLMSKVMKNVG